MTFDMLEHTQALERTFERDWQRVCAKEKFTSMMAREHKVRWEISMHCIH